MLGRHDLTTSMPVFRVNKNEEENVCKIAPVLRLVDEVYIKLQHRQCTLHASCIRVYCHFSIKPAAEAGNVKPIYLWDKRGVNIVRNNKTAIKDLSLSTSVRL